MKNDERLLNMYTALLSAIDLRKDAPGDRQTEGICRAALKNAKIALAVFDKEVLASQITGGRAGDSR